MGWDASLVDDRGHEEGYGWNYTHNTNGMIEAALGDEAIEGTAEPFWHALGHRGMGRGAWWDLLDGLEGPQGAALLDRIIRRLEADPPRFVAMNPSNGWGDYDGLLKVLSEMRSAVPEWPTKWEAGG